MRNGAFIVRISWGLSESHCSLHRVEISRAAPLGLIARDFSLKICQDRSKKTLWAGFCNEQNVLECGQDGAASASWCEHQRAYPLHVRLWEMPIEEPYCGQFVLSCYLMALTLENMWLVFLFEFLPGKSWFWLKAHHPPFICQWKSVMLPFFASSSRKLCVKACANVITIKFQGPGGTSCVFFSYTCSFSILPVLRAVSYVCLL